MRVLFCSDEFVAAREMLALELPEHDIVWCGQDDVLDHLDGVDVVVPAMAQIGAAEMDAGSFRLIQQFATGVEGIDLAAAAERGIPVANLPADETGNADAVAEVAMLHVLSLLRDQRAADLVARSGGLGEPVGRSIAERRVVVFGLGAIGWEVCRRLQGFRANVVAVGRRDPAEVADQLDALGVDDYFTMDERLAAFAGADVVIVCVRLTAETAGIVGRAEIAALRPGAILVNVARGPAVDRASLIDALRSGHVSGAGLDVFWAEPPDPGDEIFDLPVTVTPHIGGVSDRSYRLMAAAVADNVRRLAAGQEILRRVDGGG